VPYYRGPDGTVTSPEREQPDAAMLPGVLVMAQLGLRKVRCLAGHGDHRRQQGILDLVRSVSLRSR
jgi:hypothetical protein